jgi:hypothetical protein
METILMGIFLALSEQVGPSIDKLNDHPTDNITKIEAQYMAEYGITEERGRLRLGDILPFPGHTRRAEPKGGLRK